jgi:hypothetical protein
VLATLDTVRVLDGETLLATHTRSFDRGHQLDRSLLLDPAPMKR